MCLVLPFVNETIATSSPVSGAWLWNIKVICRKTLICPIVYEGYGIQLKITILLHASTYIYLNMLVYEVE